MQTKYTIDDLEALFVFAIDKGLIQSVDYSEGQNIRKFLRMIRFRELQLPQPRDTKGRFVKNG